jgi:Holliday junction resolvase RusA-like endonuclease
MQMAKRVQNSLGQVVVNNGSVLNVPTTKYQLDNTRSYIIFDVVPMGAVRMTKSDTWKLNPNHADPNKRQRPAVTKYFAFKTLLQLQAKSVNFELGRCIDAVYLVPMPDSWSKKKKESMNGMPCETKPDTDNITKAIKDTLRKEDGDIWWEKAEKRWAYKGNIIIFR